MTRIKSAVACARVRMSLRAYLTGRVNGICFMTEASLVAVAALGNSRQCSLFSPSAEAGQPGSTSSSETHALVASISFTASEVGEHRERRHPQSLFVFAAPDEH